MISSKKLLLFNFLLGYHHFGRAADSAL